jgi:hypothetical protein
MNARFGSIRPWSSRTPSPGDCSWSEAPAVCRVIRALPLSTGTVRLSTFPTNSGSELAMSLVTGGL